MSNEQKFPDDWDLKTKIDFLQRKIILNSIIYYEFDSNLITDQEYDALAKQLVRLNNEYKDIDNTQYGYAMYDFDGSTGFDIYGRLTAHDREYLTNIALSMLKRKGR